MEARSDFAWQEVTWGKIKNKVTNSSSDFAQIIDAINPSNDLTFIEAYYPFGSEIVSHGLLNGLTNSGDLLPITDTRLSPLFRNLLGYSQVPLGMVFEKSIEVYLDIGDRIFSVATWQPGLSIGIWEYSGWTTPYNVASGARSLYMIPEITLNSGHKKLKRDYSVTLPAPKNLYDHWALFKQIANSGVFHNTWCCKVIFMTKHWIEALNRYPIGHDHTWDKLHHYLLDKNLQHSFYGRRRSIFEVVWALFSSSLNTKKIKVNQYMIDTLKHILFIGTGGAPGSRPSGDSNAFGPIKQIQHAYMESYGLKKYAPTIMQPHCFSFTEDVPIYYSLQTPTLLETVPQSKKLTTIMDSVRDLMELLDYFVKDKAHSGLQIAGESISDMASQLNFDFFHAKAYAYGNDIRPSSDIPICDNALLYTPGKVNRLFADTSPYCHGCVRLSKKAY